MDIFVLIIGACIGAFVAFAFFALVSAGKDSDKVNRAELLEYMDRYEKAFDNDIEAKGYSELDAPTWKKAKRIIRGE